MSFNQKVRLWSSLVIGMILSAQGDPLDFWTKRSSDVRPVLYGVTYGNRQYVCVGQAGAILISTNGSAWQAVSSGVSGDLFGIAFADNQFLAVGAGGLILRSSNAVQWALQTSPTTNRLNAVARCGGLFLAMGNSGTLLTSPNGVAWTSQTSGTSRALVGAAFGNNLFLVVGQGQSNPGTVLTSSNGVNWVDRSTNNLGIAFYGVAFGRGVFVALDSRGIVYTTADGINWSNRWTVTTDYLFGMTFAQNVFVGVGGPYGGGSQKIVTSPDGVNWKLRPVSSVTNSASLLGVTYGNGYFIAVGGNRLIVESGPVSSLRLEGVAAGIASFLLDGEIGRAYRIQAI